MQRIFSKRHYLFAALLVLLLSFTLAACDTNNTTNGTNGNATSNGEEGINAESQGNSDEEPFEIQEVPGADDGTTSGTDGDAESPLAGQTPGTPPDTAITPGGEEGQDADATQAVGDCFEADPHPIGEAIAEDFDADYGQVMGWMCDGFSFEDILLAQQTSELTGRPAEEMLDETGSRSWSLVWQEGGLVPSSPDSDAGTGDDMATDDGDAQEPGSDSQDATATPEASDDTDATTAEQDGEGQMVFEDGAMQWTGDEFELTGTVASKDEANRTIDVRARNEEGTDQIYAFAVGENGIFDEIEEGDRVRVTGERLEDGTVVAYEMQALPDAGSQDGEDGDAQDSQGAGFAGLAPGEFEFRGTILSTDAEERSFELQVAQPDMGESLDDLLEGDDDTNTSPLPTGTPTATNGLDDSDVVTGTNGLDDSDMAGTGRLGEEQTYTFYVPESLSFDAFGIGDVIEVEIEPLDAGLSGDQDAMDTITGTDDITGTDTITGTDDITDTDDITGTDTITGTDDSDVAGDDSSDDSATGDSDLAGDDDDAGQDMDDSLNGDALGQEPWGMVEYELVGTVEAVDETAGSIDVLVLHDGGQEETYTFVLPDDESLSHYQAGARVEIEVQIEATAAEMGQREVLNGELADDSDTGNGDADDTDLAGSLFGQGPVGLGAGEFEFRGTVVSVNEADGSFDLRPDARYLEAMGRQDGDAMDTGTDTITGTDEITGTDPLTGTNGISGSESMTGTNGMAEQGLSELLTFYVPQGRSLASFGEGDVVEVEIEPAVTGGLFGLNGDLLDDQDDTDSNAGQDDTDADTSEEMAGDNGQDAQAEDGQDSMGLFDDALTMASFELMGEVVAVDEDAGTIDVRVMRPDDVTGTNGLTGDDDSDLAPTDSITATEPVTGTDDTDGDMDDSDMDDSDMAPTVPSQAAEEIYTFFIADVRARQYYQPGTLVEIEIDLEESADLEGMDGDADSGQASAAAGQFCAAGVTGEHSLADAIAETYGADVQEIRGWYCEDTLGFGEIMLALTTADVSGEPVEDVANRRLENESWGEIWQDMGLISRVEDAGEMNDRLSDD